MVKVASGAFPVIDAGGSGFSAGSLADYFGIPPGVADLEVSALPFRAYNMIFNTKYRDQDLVTAVTEDSNVVQSCAWEKDYFTTCRPWPQKGPEVTLPLGTRADVKGLGMQYQVYPLNTTAHETGETAATSFNPAAAAGTEMFVRGTAASGGFPDIYADLSSATAVSVNEVREAFALQRMMEARAMFGSRYTEYLRYLGVRSSDARLQEPEYLGGGKQTISFSEVLQTGVDSGDGGVGTLRGHGISAVRSRRYRRFFNEHGVVLTLMSVRPRALYTNGLSRMWSRRVKEDFWQPELERIGQQEVYRREVFAQSDGAGGNTVFGYQDRYAEYRHEPSLVVGEFRDTLDFWHLGRIFGGAPTLNASFIECDPSKRIHAVATNDVLWVMVSNSIQARRPVGNRVIGRIL